MMWYNEFINKYKAGISHEFLLHFNVRDFVDDRRNIEKYIYDEFIIPRKFSVVAFYDISRGLRFMDDGMEREFAKITRNAADTLYSAMPSKIFPHIDQLLQNTKAIVFFDHTDKLIPAGDTASMSFEERTALIWLCEWSVNARISSVGSAILMLADNMADVSREILKSSYKVEPVLVELPNETQREEYIKSLFCPDTGISGAHTGTGNSAGTAPCTVVGTGTGTGVGPGAGTGVGTGTGNSIATGTGTDPAPASAPAPAPFADTGISITEFAKLTSGLSRKAIKDIKLRAEAEDVPVSFEFIKDKKHSVLKKEFGDVLDFIYPEIGFESVGGMEKAKNYLIKNIVQPVRQGDLRRVPMGILFCGPSGTGKTLLVHALAKASGFNCVRIDMSRILGQYVGESEKNFKKCLLGAQSQEPVIIFVDEIDTAFRRGEGEDSGVSRNIFSEFLQFAGNTANRGKVIFVAATNRPDLLDPALKRAGRFDKKIPILMPEQDERAEIFRIMVRKYRFDTDIADFTPFAAKTENYTGAEIETVVRKAYELANEDDTPGGFLTAELLSLAVGKCRPATRHIEFMTMLAVDECEDLDLLPDRYKAMKE